MATKIDEIHEVVVRIDERLKNHIDNSIIHQVPPCEQHKGLISKLWAVVVLCLGSLASSLYVAIKLSFIEPVWIFPRCRRLCRLCRRGLPLRWCPAGVCLFARGARPVRENFPGPVLYLPTL